MKIWSLPQVCVAFFLTDSAITRAISLNNHIGAGTQLGLGIAEVPCVHSNPPHVVRGISTVGIFICQSKNIDFFPCLDTVSGTLIDSRQITASFRSPRKGFYNPQHLAKRLLQRSPASYVCSLRSRSRRWDC